MIYALPGNSRSHSAHDCSQPITRHSNSLNIFSAHSLLLQQPQLPYYSCLSPSKNHVIWTEMRKSHTNGGSWKHLQQWKWPLNSAILIADRWSPIINTRTQNKWKELTNAKAGRYRSCVHLSPLLTTGCLIFIRADEIDDSACPSQQPLKNCADQQKLEVDIDLCASGNVWLFY